MNHELQWPKRSNGRMLMVMKLLHTLQFVTRPAKNTHGARFARGAAAAALVLVTSVASAQTAAPANEGAGTRPAPTPLPQLPASTPEASNASPAPGAAAMPTSGAPASPSGAATPTPGAPATPNGAPATAEPTHPSAYDIATDTDPSALTAFREPLAPYGTWAEDTTYGVVWTPSSAVVGVDFAPYVSHGRWGMGVDNSWTWISDFNWGWAPFHYGRWVWIDGRGWSWIPGRVYSPAWVVWRTGFYGDHYVGWAPMPPTWYWRAGYAHSLWRVPMAPYVFCPSSRVFSPGVRSYIAPASLVGQIAPRTRPYVAAPGGDGASANYRAAALTRGPSAAEARIPAASIPENRVSADPRAAALSRPSSMGLRSADAYGGVNGAPSQRPSIGDQRGFAGGPNGVDRPGLPSSGSLTGPGAGSQQLRPFAGGAPSQALPSTPSMRPFYGPSEIPRPTPRPFAGGSPSSGGFGGAPYGGAPYGGSPYGGSPYGGGGSGLRPMAPPSWGGGSPGGGEMFRPMPRPSAPPSFGGGGGGSFGGGFGGGGSGLRPMSPGGSGGGSFGRPQAR